PEVLRGQPYTLASDIYSFSIIIWEFKYGIPPFDNEAHDFQLSLNICKGKRPKIIKNIPQCYNNLMKKCWDMNPLKRPTASEIKRIIENWKENIIEEDFKKELKDDILDFYKADKIIKWKSSINLSVSKIINNELTLKFHLNPLIDTVKLNEILNPNIDEIINKDLNEINETLNQNNLNEIENQEKYVYNYNYSEFKNIQKIGGTFTKVYCANWKYADSFFVILKSFNYFNNKMIEEIIKELKLQQKIKNHPNIIQFYGITSKKIGEDSKYTYVLEYADSNSLNYYLDKYFDQLDWMEKYKLALQLASAVLYLHKNDIIYCNLNAFNIFIHQKNIKLSNLGLSKKINRESKMLGAYIDPKVLMWQISSGYRPFYNEDDIIQGRREKIIPDTPIEYSSLYTKCWKYEPKERPHIKQIVNNLDQLSDTKFDNHSKNIVIHDGNAKITDFGISKNMNNDTSFHNVNFGRIPYIDPKKLSDVAFQYIKASDIYSFGVLMWEISSGIPLFKDDIDDPVVLSIAIAKGAREATINNTPEDYEKLYKQCWDSEPGKRPTINIILENIKKFIIENLYQTCLDSNPEKEPTIYEVLEVSKTMGLLGLPFEELFQKYFDKCPNKAEINVNDNNISAEESFNSISEMQSDELDLDNIQSKSYSDLCL
ncbi:14846_t:CDS:2, partial [Funneliformis geosporum]